MIKVLHVFATTGLGGYQTFVMSIYRNINKNIFQFDFIKHSPVKGEIEDEIHNYGGNIYQFPQFSPYNVNRYLRTWDEFFDNHNDYEVIHVHYFTLAGLILPIAKKHGVKVRIVHSHAAMFDSTIKKVLFTFFRKRMIKSATHLLACSNDAGRAMFCNENFRVINNAIDSSKFEFSQEGRKSVRNEFNILEDEKVIGHVGSFRNFQKNHTFILDIFSKLLEDDDKLRLLLVGDGKLKNEMENKANRLGISQKVIFTGVRKDIPSVLSAMDLFLFPSILEGLGIVAIEAQVSGLPTIVSTEVPCEAYISDLVTALSLNENMDTWIHNILYSLHLNIDRLSYKDVAKKNDYEIKDIVKKIEAIYQNS